MSTKSKKFVLLVTVLITVASLLVACGAPPTEAPVATEAPTEVMTEAPTEVMTEAPTEAPATEAPAGGEGPFTIGISNPFISSEYRTQMIDELIQDISEDYNITTIVVTHDMNSVMGIGEKILFIYKGMKLWEGNKNEITHSHVQELDDFVFANKVMSSLRGEL